MASEVPRKTITLDPQAILETVESADREFAQSLLLFAERIVLYRLTRVKFKVNELGLMVDLIKQIVSSSKGEDAVPPEVAQLELLGNEEEESLNNVFSIVIDAVEKMDSQDLLKLVGKLRQEQIREGI